MKIRRIMTGRDTSSGSRYRTSVISVPKDIAQLIPEGMEFRCELTDDGILYRPVAFRPVARPRWAQVEDDPPRVG